MRKLFFVGAALMPALFAPWSQAGVILSDSFNYPDGALTNVSGGIWVHHSGAVLGEVQVVSGRALLSQNNGEDVNAQLAGQPYVPTSNTVLYVSFSINFATLPTGSNGSYFVHFKDSGISNFRDRIFVSTNGAAANSFRLGVANSDTAASVFLPASLSLNTDYFVVSRYVLSNAASTVWLNPASEASSGVTATDSASTITVTSFALRESFSSPNGMGTLYLDNLLVGTSFADVVPNTPPAITAQPQSQSVSEGSDVTFNVGVSGSAPFIYQWTFYATNLVSETNSSLFLYGVTSNQAGPYAVAVTNAYGFTNSQTVTLTVNPAIPPTIIAGPQSQSVFEGATVTFNVVATGAPPPTYQWQFNQNDLPGATGSSITLSNVIPSQGGLYSVIVSNFGGSTNSDPAVLTVTPAAQVAALSYLTYNLEGFGATNWTTNSPQIQAIGREVMYLNPDILGFNEIPNPYYYEMTNFVKAFLPGYYLAVSTTTDGALRNGVASRFPIVSSISHLRTNDLNPYGYTNSNFTRDLFEAQISVPNFPQLLHVFVVHLKSGQGTDDSLRRGAEASAISNFFYTVFLPTNTSFHPYLLSGDMNEDISRPPSSHPMSIQRLINSATGLQLTTPVNPYTGSELTHSIQSGLVKRYDYIMPCGLLFSNIVSSQVFRTDLLTNPPPPLQTNDDITASDHLPVFMVFSNPYDKPFRLLSIAKNPPAATIRWQSVAGQPYRIEVSSNLTSWQILANNLVATGSTFTFSSNLLDPTLFFKIGK